MLFKMFKITKTPDKNISFQTVLSIEHGGFVTEFKVVFENENIYRIEAMTKNEIGQFVHGGASDKCYKHEQYAYAKSYVRKMMYQYASKYIAQILKSQLKDVLYYG